MQILRLGSLKWVKLNAINLIVGVPVESDPVNKRFIEWSIVLDAMELVKNYE